MISIKMFNEIKEFFNDENIRLDWTFAHTSVEFDDSSKTVSIVIYDMDEQKYKWIKTSDEVINENDR